MASPTSKTEESDVKENVTEYSVEGKFKFHILNKIGQGAYAKVYRAEYTTKKRTKILACKIINPNTANEDYIEHYLPTELKIIKILNHNSIIQFECVVQHRKMFFIFMEYAEKGDLTDYIAAHGAVGESQAQIWFHQIAAGIEYLHANEVAHRDLKCENILITSHMNVKVSDFGCSCILTDSKGKSLARNTYCGTLLYMAPEVVRYAPYYPKTTDIWSLGIILYITVNGTFPFKAENEVQLYMLQTKRSWRFNAEVADSLSDQVKSLITQLLEPNTFKRPKIDNVMLNAWVTPRVLNIKPKPKQQTKCRTRDERSSRTPGKKPRTS